MLCCAVCDSNRHTSYTLSTLLPASHLQAALLSGAVGFDGGGDGGDGNGGDGDGGDGLGDGGGDGDGDGGRGRGASGVSEDSEEGLCTPQWLPPGFERTSLRWRQTSLLLPYPTALLLYFATALQH